MIVEDAREYLTEQGCLVRSYRQTNAHGLESEHVVLSTPTADHVDPQDTTSEDDLHG